MKPTDVDAGHMRAALSLAARGLGQVWPNPSVGCVLVSPSGLVVGRGRTQKGGRPHAETVALQQAGQAARGACAYVTLEPCAHHGKTPPCVEGLIAAGIARCVIAMEDPDPRVAGAGITRLQGAGVIVDVGILNGAAAELNRGYLARQRLGRPFVALKFATTLDGKIATAQGQSKWITGSSAREFGHRLRATYDAILVGSGTVLMDNPELTCRLPGLSDRSPVSIILDRRGRLDASARVFSKRRPATAWVVSTPAGAGELRNRLNNSFEIIVIEEDNDQNDWLGRAMTALGDRGLTRILVEGGPTISTSFLRAGLVDRLYWFRAASLMGDPGLGAFGDLGVRVIESAPCAARKDLRLLGEDVLEVFDFTS